MCFFFCFIVLLCVLMCLGLRDRLFSRKWNSTYRVWVCVCVQTAAVRVLIGLSERCAHIHMYNFLCCQFHNFDGSISLSDRYDDEMSNCIKQTSGGQAWLCSKLLIICWNVRISLLLLPPPFLLHSSYFTLTNVKHFDSDQFFFLHSVASCWKVV